MMTDTTGPVLVTGGASGSGEAVARLLAERREPVLVLDLDEDGAARVTKEIDCPDVRSASLVR